MLRKTTRFLNLVLLALALGMAFCHFMEMTGKSRLAAHDWLTVQHTLYVEFGGAGAVIEVSAILLTWIVLLQARGRKPAFFLTLAAAVLVSSALAVWIVFIDPVNAQISAWTYETMPPDWARYRSQWETAHALRALLFGLGFSTLLTAVMMEVPDKEA